MKIAIVDTYYGDFLNTLPALTEDYETELAKLLSRGFGTHSGYSHYLRAEGHEVIDIIANHHQLQELWEREHGLNGFVVGEQLAEFKPDVIFLQDIGYFPAARLKEWRSSGYVIAAQCSCALDPSVDITPIDVIFSSLPTHLPKFEALGVRAEYLPLAFDPRMLPPERPRDLDISFVGGVGRGSHWRYGTDVLEIVAERFGSRFHWYGYGLSNLSAESPLRACYWGDAFGRKQYEIYSRSKIVVNRHGEIAEGFSNNLRMYESTGAGALLITEASPNLPELFPEGSVATYENPEDLCMKIEGYLANERTRTLVAQAGQMVTLRDHGYDSRMKTVSKVLAECLEARKVGA